MDSIAPPQVVSRGLCAEEACSGKVCCAEETLKSASLRVSKGGHFIVRPMGQVQFEMVEGFPPGSSGRTSFPGLRKTLV